MIVIGTDTHKATHTCGAVIAGTGRLAGEMTASARKPGFRELLDWGRSLDEERIWAIEDCRHVSGSFERFLVASGARVRHRLDRGGNRQLNCALHRIAVTQGRVHPPAASTLLESKRRARPESKPYAASSGTWRVGFGSFWSILQSIDP